MLFFSEHIKSTQYSNSWATIEAVLAQYQVPYSFLKETKDIWCRDYMPVKSAEAALIQFRYEPTYLQDYLHLQSETQLVLKANNIQATFSNINLDGGNVVINNGNAIITNRVFLENPSIGKEKLIAEIESLLKLKVHVIPALTRGEDMTGHADGYVRFINEDTLLVTSLDGEYDYFKKRIYEARCFGGFSFYRNAFIL